MKNVLPVTTVLLALLAIWYIAAALMNAPLQEDAFANAGRTDYSTGELIAATWEMERPKLPTPHQIVSELYKLTIETAPTSKRGLVYHAIITLEETLIGFLFGAGFGIGLAVLIQSSPVLSRSMMPWIVASQTVPIIALAPMIVVILNQFNVTGLAPKAVIAAYLSFFPITVGMVKGFRSPDPLQLDLMRTYFATRRQTFVKLRAPASAPFFFASMQIGAAAALVGAVVAEVTKSEDGGLGARLLAGSYYGQTVQIWAALVRRGGAVGGAGRPDRAHRAPRPPSHGVQPMNAKVADLIPPLLFGVAVLAIWEVGVRLAGVPTIILPAPTAIFLRFVSSTPTLAADFLQTIRGVLGGYLIGSGAGLLVAILIDRSPFLQRGLLPLGNLVSALPIVGVAPIMVMWFGFDWQSKAAVVVVMTFFPMLVSATAGLAGGGSMERDLMKTYAADYSQTLRLLRLPGAAPFVFNALKINTTLAMIGAIVAEFFGTPTVGMGFRISTEVGHLSIDMVWATILVAAITGSAFYALVALIERRVTFWHASYRTREN